MWPLSKGQERGVGLVETLVAVAILGFVGVLMVQGMYYIIQGDTVTRTNVGAEDLARSELEYVKSVSDNWTNISRAGTPPWSYTIPGGSPGYPQWDSSHKNLPSGYTGYTVTVQSSSPVSGKTSIQQVTVTVKYNGVQKAQISEYITDH